MISQETHKLRIQPVAVAKLDGEPMTLWQFFEEWNESIRELMAVAQHRTIEEWKLKHDWTKLLTEQVHCFKELSKLGSAVHQNLLMRDDLRHFDRENEAFGSSGCPVAHSPRRRARVKC